MYNVCMCVCKYAYIDFPKISLLERGYHIYVYIYIHIAVMYIYICVCLLIIALLDHTQGYWVNLHGV